ncbi:ABC transporter permease [Limisphaera sp. VF-2]|jgi:spermidine/putrescine transport system permease protein|uniref:ABC transporter permease n=1 Tax=Limisphaera sp. VF-2 TaxID=3400418 RepID=UPI001750F7FB
MTEPSYVAPCAPVSRGSPVCDRTGTDTPLRQGLGPAALVCGVPVLWMLLFFLFPLLGLAVMSFFSRGPDGEVAPPLTWENYRRLLGFGELGFDPFYPVVLGRSLLLGAATTLLCLLSALPLALWLARLPRRWQLMALTLVVIPFWTNFLVRTYAWQVLLSPDSPLTRLLNAVGIGQSGAGLYPGWGAVLTAMVCDFLPFMVLPIYVAAERLNWTLVEAAMDLGANRWQAFRHAVWPQLRPGVAAGSILVFLPATGQFVVPDLLGGAKLAFLGNLLQQQFGPSRDWPFGAALATATLGLMLLALAWRARSAARQETHRP